MNIFEGGRRIAKVLAGSIVLIIIVTNLDYKPYVGFYYAIDEKNNFKYIGDCLHTLERFRPNVKERPDVSITVCGYTEGPSTVSLPAEELARIDKALSEKRKSDILFKLGVLAGLLFTIWFMSWSIGWIVRGFLGIPRGQDKK